MSTVQITSKKGTEGVKKLREQKLRSGLPFMINVTELSSNQCYLEYPNGSIKLITFLQSSQEVNVIRELTSTEAISLRNRLRFSSVK